MKLGRERYVMLEIDHCRGARGGGGRLGRLLRARNCFSFLCNDLKSGRAGITGSNKSNGHFSFILVYP